MGYGKAQWTNAARRRHQDAKSDLESDSGDSRRDGLQCVRDIAPGDTVGGEAHRGARATAAEEMKKCFAHEYRQQQGLDWRCGT